MIRLQSVFFFRSQQRTNQSKRIGEPRVGALVAATVSFMVFGIVALAANTQVQQVTRSTGSVLPLGDFTRIESLDGGIVAEVGAQDGETVRAGQVLLVLKNPDLDRQHGALSEQVAALQLREENALTVLQVLENGRHPTPKDIAEAEEAGLLIAAARLQLFAESQAARTASLEQRQSTSAILQDAVIFSQERLDRQIARMNEQRQLLDRGLSLRAAFQSESDRTDTLRAAVAEATVRLAEAKDAIELARSEQIRERLNLLKENVDEAAQTAESLATARANLRVLDSRLEGLTLRAPSSGTLQTIIFTHQGEIISPGETLFELLPTGSNLVTEIQIPSADVGYVHNSQAVSISIDTFDVRRFGKMDGTLTTISPVPIVDPQTGAASFRAIVELHSQTIGEGIYERQIQAGMTAVAEMVTREQTLMAYFLKPVQNTLERAFSER